MNHVINELVEVLMSPIVWVTEYSSVLTAVAIDCGCYWLDIFSSERFLAKLLYFINKEFSFPRKVRTY